ncbi:hypothetical protein D3C85_1615470 [compost metagenome]
MTDPTLYDQAAQYYDLRHGSGGYTRLQLIGMILSYEHKVPNPDITLEEMETMTAGSVVGIACDKCEGHEKHIKQQNGTWRCDWCGDVKEMKG